MTEDINDRPSLKHLSGMLTAGDNSWRRQIITEEIGGNEAVEIG